MELCVKKLTDENGTVWVLIYAEGMIQEPLTLFRDFEALNLCRQIQDVLKGT